MKNMPKKTRVVFFDIKIVLSENKHRIKSRVKKETIFFNKYKKGKSKSERQRIKKKVIFSFIYFYWDTWFDVI